MRWDRLFADLEGQLAAAQHEEFEAEVADRTRRDLALVHMADRLAAATGRRVSVAVLGVGDVAGSITRIGDDWVLLASDASHDVVVFSHAILAVRDLPSYAVAAGHRADAKLGVGHVMRAVARDRMPVMVHLVDGSWLEGTIDRVGADFVDIAEHPAGELRPTGSAARHRSVTFHGMAVVRAAG